MIHNILLKIEEVYLIILNWMKSLDLLKNLLY